MVLAIVIDLMHCVGGNTRKRVWLRDNAVKLFAGFPSARWKC
jgi:hypothetical protein